MILLVLWGFVNVNSTAEDNLNVAWVNQKYEESGPNEHSRNISIHVVISKEVLQYVFCTRAIIA